MFEGKVIGSVGSDCRACILEYSGSLLMGSRMVGSCLTSYLEGGMDLREERLSFYLEKGLVYSLIYGNLMSTEEIQSVIEILGLNTIPNMVMVIHFDNFEMMSKEKSEEWKRVFRETLQSLIKSYWKREIILSSIVGVKRVVLLYGSQEREKNRAQEDAILVANGLKTYLEKETYLQISIGIGGYYNDPRSLDLSYQEALHALSQSFFTDKSQVHSLGEIRPYQEKAPNYNLQLVEILKTSIQQGNKEEALEMLNQILDSLCQETITPSLFRMQALELLFVLSKAISKYGISREELYSMDLQYAEKILGTTIVSSVKSILREALENFMEIFMNRHNHAHLHLVNQAMDYMEKNYAQDINLYEVASSVHLSPYYFSRIFKQETDSTFLEYLSKLRIEKARRLLVDGTLPIGEVAVQVGYPNQNYFSRVFKKEVGLTPSEYRGKF